MERAIAFCLFALAGLCGLTTLMVLLSAPAGDPMPPKVAMILSAMFAPVFAWWCMRKVPARPVGAPTAFDRAAASAAARQFEGQLGQAIVKLMELGPADASVLIGALSIEDGEVFMLTADGSPNFRAWQALAELGLMGEAAAEPEVAREPQLGRRFYLTPAGRTFVPDFLMIAAAFRRKGFVVKVDDVPPGFFEALAARQGA